MSNLSKDNILHLGRLSRLDLNEEEQGRYASQLSSVVKYIEQLSEVDTSKTKALFGVTGMSNVLADDLPRPEGDLCQAKKEDLLKGAPVSEDGFFVVRAVMSEEVVSA